MYLEARGENMQRAQSKPFHRLRRANFDQRRQRSQFPVLGGRKYGHRAVRLRPRPGKAGFELHIGGYCDQQALAFYPETFAGIFAANK